MRTKCRFCENERKKGVEWYDDDYCSGKCKQADGGKVAPEAERIKTTGTVASLEDYLLDYPKKLGQKDARGQRIKGRVPKRYRLRYEPERLNWGESMNESQLEQAGFRANREPIPGDWDYKTVPESRILNPEKVISVNVSPNKWQVLKAKAKSLGIQTYAKNREQIEAEIKEKENG